MSEDKETISVIIPAMNEENVIGHLISETIKVLMNLHYSHEIIVVDDGSTDNTAKIALDSGAKVIKHPYNIGNGAAIKTGIRNAVNEWLVMMDGDGQHSPEYIPQLLEKLKIFDMLVGARTRDSETAFHRDVANLIYNKLATYICGRKIEDLTSGFRGIKTKIAKDFVNLLPNTFSYPTTLTLAITRSGYSLSFIPIKTKKRVGRSKINLLKDGIQFFLIIIKVSTFFSPLKVFLPISISMFMLGIGYGLFKVLFLGMRYGPTSAMLMIVSVLIFLIGLVSEQIAQMRFDLGK